MHRGCTDKGTLLQRAGRHAVGMAARHGTAGTGRQRMAWQTASVARVHGCGTSCAWLRHELCCSKAVTDKIEAPDAVSSHRKSSSSME